MIFEPYDLIVVGGGHAGAEASLAAAKMGVKVLLITQMLDTICQMSCNPAMGGVAKGQIVREIDALGGGSGVVTDLSALQFRMLNRSKGPAMWSPRAQCDRMMFSQNWRRMLEKAPNLAMWQDEAVGLLFDGKAVAGVVTRMGLEIRAKAVILTAGTFLGGKIYIGEGSWQGGRIGEAPSNGITESLRAFGFEVGRLKTGTPVRVDGRTIDFSRLQEQPGDDNPGKFSFSDTKALTHQRSCYLANTNLRTHDILRTGFAKSPLFTGRIAGRGPRYCPSIEDKIERFADKDHHQLFVEPEGWHSQSWYLNGFSSSLPLGVQLEALHSIEGFEQARIFKPGYAIEYDYFPPTQLGYTLETKLVENLYFAGQINGTTGYEEAACQGLMAGINAARKIHGKAPFVLGRSEAYIGVLIDDLVTKGVDEPYRMFTSRAEYRILLRQDNADQRLTPKGYDIGLADEARMRRLDEKMDSISVLKRRVENLSVSPTEANEWLAAHNSAELSQRVRMSSLLLRPEFGLLDLADMSPELKGILSSVSEDVKNAVEVEIKYKRYIEKEREAASRMLKFEDVLLPTDYDYFSLEMLSYEAREKLTRNHPANIGQASRISGVSPADMSVLLLVFAR